MKHLAKARILSAILAIAMIAALFPAAVFATETNEAFVSQTHDVFSRTTSTIAPGVTQDICYAYAKNGKQMVYYVATADITREDVSVYANYKDNQCSTFGMAKLTEQMAAAEANHTDPNSESYIPYYKAVAGVNADFYNMTTGQPSGAFVMEGTITNNANNRPFFAILDDGTPIIGANNTDWNAISGRVKEAVGGSVVLVKNGQDITAGAGGNYNIERHSRTCVGYTADNKVVMMVLDGRQEPFSCGGSMHELAQIMLEAGCVAAINLDGGGSTTFAARQEGANEVSIVNRPSDGSERAISSSLLIVSTAVPSNVFDRAVLTAEYSHVTPGSTVNVSAVGVSPAGTSAEIPETVSWQLKDSAMGTVENGVFVSNGTVGDAVVQMVLDGAVVGETTIHVVIPETLSFAQDVITVPYDKTVALELVATYGLNKVVVKPADVSFTLSDSAMGSIEDFSFTACSESTGLTTGTVTAALGANSEISCSATMNFGKGSEVLMDFEDGNLGSLYIKTGYPQYGPMGSKLDANGNYYYNGQNEIGKVEIVTAETGKVHDGSYALAVECDFSQAYETGYHMLTLRGFEIEIPAKAQTLGMWIYLPELEEIVSTSMRFSGQTKTAAESGSTSANVSSPWLWDNCAMYAASQDGWHYVTMDISGYNDDITMFLLQLYICDRDNTAVNYKFTEHASVNGRFTYYLDSITVDYSSAVDDREFPVFDYVRASYGGLSDAVDLKGQTINSNVVSVTAKAADNMVKNNYSGLDISSAKAYIDGVELTEGFTCSDAGIMTIDDVTLADATHTFKFEICDKMGNLAYIERQITVAANSDIPVVQLVPANPTGDKLPIGSLYWMNLVATDAANVSEVTMNLNLNSVSSWELDHMIVADGFEADYEIDPVTNNAKVTVKNVNAQSKRSASDVIAQLPIRTWVSTITQCEGYESQTPAKLWARKIIWPMDIKLSVDLGAVSYMDGSKGSFSMTPLAVLTELYGNYAELNANGDYANKSSWHIHTETAVSDQAPTCTEDGFTGRTYCEVCDSVANWGETIPATGHSYETIDGLRKCSCGELFNGEYEGKLYVDGLTASGWINDSYYVDGVKLTGIVEVEGYYYNFGEDGICAGKAKYTGLFFNEAKNAYCYALFGELATGWRMIGDAWYYFDEATAAALVGSHTLTVKGVAVPFTFDETGRLTKEVWYTNANNQTYLYYGPGYYSRVWKEIDGKTYFFNWVGVAARGIYGVQDSPHMPELFYLFDLETCELIAICDGFMTYGGSTYYYHTHGSNAKAYGFYCIDGKYYYFSTSTGAMRTGDYTVMSYSSNGLLDTHRTFHFDETYGYAVDANGNPLTSLEEPTTPEDPSGYPKFVEKNGKTYYYKSESAMAFGFYCIEGKYYYFSTSTGEMRTGDYKVLTYTSNGLLSENRSFHFDETHGYAVDENGNPLTSLDAPAPDTGSYPKFVTQDGKTYYYKSESAMAFGFYCIDGKYYYFSTSTGAMRTGDYKVMSYTSNGLLDENRSFHFDETYGYAVDGNGNPLTSLEDPAPETGSYPKFVTKDGNTYYYKSENALAFGFQCIDGKYYYFSTSTGAMRTGEYNVKSYTSNGLLTSHTTFFFDTTYGYAIDENGDPITSLT